MQERRLVTWLGRLEVFPYTAEQETVMVERDLGLTCAGREGGLGHAGGQGREEVTL